MRLGTMKILKRCDTNIGTVATQKKFHRGDKCGKIYATVTVNSIQRQETMIWI